MASSYRTRRIVGILIVVGISVVTLLTNPQLYESVVSEPLVGSVTSSPALTVLETLPVKGRAAKTGYDRTQFGSGWLVTNGCDTRNIVLNRDLKDPVVDDECKVVSGTLNDPYTGKTISFVRGAQTSQLVQIDHVVALSNAWQTGAQQLTPLIREQLANDPLNLLAVDGAANQQKSDGDTATWLPANKPFRCQYVARQIAVKAKYTLWLTPAEKDAMVRVLAACPSQSIPS